MPRPVVSIVLGVLGLTACRGTESTEPEPTVAATSTEAASKGLRVGDPAPDFTLPASDGTTVALADRLAAGPVVVVFYRGDW